MSYPGWPPSYRVVDRVKDKHRTCLVIDLLSDRPLTPSELAVLAERLEATAARRESRALGLEVGVFTADKFDRVVLEGLRLPAPGTGPVESPGEEDPFDQPSEGVF